MSENIDLGLVDPGKRRVAYSETEDRGWSGISIIQEGFVVERVSSTTGFFIEGTVNSVIRRLVERRGDRISRRDRRLLRQELIELSLMQEAERQRKLAALAEAATKPPVIREGWFESGQLKFVDRLLING